MKVRSAWLCLAALLLGLGLISSPWQAGAATTNPAVQEYGGCLNAAKQGDLLLLFDESLSLRTSDKPDGRVVAARYLVGQLAEVATRESIDLSVAVAGFSDDYHPTLGWTGLRGAGSAQVLQAVDQFKTRDDGVQTDYWNGLNGARSELSSRAEGDPNRCQAIVWFSDGKFDVSLSKNQYQDHPSARAKAYGSNLDLGNANDAVKAKAAAEQDLCRPKGLADQLRIGGITLFAVGLTSTDASVSDFTTMQDVSTGSHQCGRRQHPTPGTFTAANNIDDLIFAFGKIGRTGTETNPPLCQSADANTCRKLAQSFVLDESITNVHLLATTNAPQPKAIGVYLFEPGRVPAIPLPRKGTRLDPPGSSFHWITDKTLSIDLVNANRRAPNWTGQWTLVFLDPTKRSAGVRAKVSISITGNLFPSWPAHAKTRLYTGDTVRGLHFGLADDKGRPIDPAALRGTGSLNADLVEGDGSVRTIAHGIGLREVARRSNALPLGGVPPGRAQVKLTLQVRTAALNKKIGGTDLTPQVVTIPVDVLPPRGTPQLGRLADFGSITGSVDASTTLPVTGPGCVWMSSASPDVEAGPQEVGATTITSSAKAASTCFRVPAGQTAQLPLRLTTQEPGNGTLAGKMPLVVSPLDAPDKQTVVQVDFKADLHKPLQALNFALALIAALLLGPGIPLALLALVKRLTAQIPGRPLLAQKMTVQVRAGQVLRDGAPLALRDTDFANMVPLVNRGSRSTQALGTPLQTRTGLSPFGAGFVTAETPGQVALSSTHPEPYGKQHQARLPLAVHDTWVASRASAAPAGEASLLLLAGLDPTGERRRKLLEDVAARLPDLMPRLGAGQASTQEVPDPIGSSLTGGSTTAVDYFSSPGATPSMDHPDTAGAANPAGKPPTESWSFDSAFNDDGH